MRKTHTDTIETETIVTDDILCNMCGGSCRDVESVNYEGLLEVTVQGGYNALLGYMTAYTFSLCEPCLSKLFEQFQIKPSLTG